MAQRSLIDAAEEEFDLQDLEATPEPTPTPAPSEEPSAIGRVVEGVSSLLPEPGPTATPTPVPGPQPTRSLLEAGEAAEQEAAEAQAPAAYSNDADVVELIGFFGSEFIGGAVGSDAGFVHGEASGKTLEKLGKEFNLDPAFNQKLELLRTNNMSGTFNNVIEFLMSDAAEDFVAPTGLPEDTQVAKIAKRARELFPIELNAARSRLDKLRIQNPKTSFAGQAAGVGGAFAAGGGIAKQVIPNLGKVAFVNSTGRTVVSEGAKRIAARELLTGAIVGGQRGGVKLLEGDPVGAGIEFGSSTIGGVVGGLGAEAGAVLGAPLVAGAKETLGPILKPIAKAVVGSKFWPRVTSLATGMDVDDAGRYIGDPNIIKNPAAKKQAVADEVTKRMTALKNDLDTKAVNIEDARDQFFALQKQVKGSKAAQNEKIKALESQVKERVSIATKEAMDDAKSVPESVIAKIDNSRSNLIEDLKTMKAESWKTLGGEESQVTYSEVVNVLKENLIEMDKVGTLGGRGRATIGGMIKKLEQRESLARRTDLFGGSPKVSPAHLRELTDELDDLAWAKGAQDFNKRQETALKGTANALRTMASPEGSESAGLFARMHEKAEILDRFDKNFGKTRNGVASAWKRAADGVDKDRLVLEEFSAATGAKLTDDLTQTTAIRDMMLDPKKKISFIKDQAKRLEDELDLAVERKKIAQIEQEAIEQGMASGSTASLRDFQMFRDARSSHVALKKSVQEIQLWDGLTAETKIQGMFSALNPKGPVWNNIQRLAGLTDDDTLMTLLNEANIANQIGPNIWERFTRLSFMEAASMAGMASTGIEGITAKALPFQLAAFIHGPASVIKTLGVSGTKMMVGAISGAKGILSASRIAVIGADGRIKQHLMDGLKEMTKDLTQGSTIQLDGLTQLDLSELLRELNLSKTETGRIQNDINNGIIKGGDAKKLLTTGGSTSKREPSGGTTVLEDTIRNKQAPPARHMPKGQEALFKKEENF